MNTVTGGYVTPFPGVTDTDCAPRLKLLVESNSLEGSELVRVTPGTCDAAGGTETLSKACVFRLIGPG